VTDNVTPAVRVEYKKTKVKQITSRKGERCAPRPSSTIPDFGIGKG
jgi:hypothetical protein